MTKALAVRIDKALLDAVDSAVAEDGRSRSEVVREALERWLEQRTLEAKVEQHRRGYQRHPVTAEEFAPILGAQIWPK